MHAVIQGFEAGELACADLGTICRLHTQLEDQRGSMRATLVTATNIGESVKR